MATDPEKKRKKDEEERQQGGRTRLRRAPAEVISEAERRRPRLREPDAQAREAAQRAMVPDAAIVDLDRRLQRRAAEEMAERAAAARRIEDALLSGMSPEWQDVYRGRMSLTGLLPERPQPAEIDAVRFLTDPSAALAEYRSAERRARDDYAARLEAVEQDIIQSLAGASPVEQALIAGRRLVMGSPPQPAARDVTRTPADMAVERVPEAPSVRGPTREVSPGLTTSYDLSALSDPQRREAALREMAADYFTPTLGDRVFQALGLPASAASAALGAVADAAAGAIPEEWKREHIQPRVRWWAEGVPYTSEFYDERLTSRLGRGIAQALQSVDASLTGRLIRSPFVGFSEEERRELLRDLPENTLFGDMLLDVALTMPYAGWFNRLSTPAKLAVLGAEGAALGWALPYEDETSPLMEGAMTAGGYKVLSGLGRYGTRQLRQLAGSRVGQGIAQALQEADAARLARRAEANIDELQRAADAARLRGREEMAQALEGEIANIRSSLPEVTRLGRATDIAREAATTGAWAAGVGGLAYGLQPAESPSTEAASTTAEDAALTTAGGALQGAGGLASAAAQHPAAVQAMQAAGQAATPVGGPPSSPGALGQVRASTRVYSAVSSPVPGLPPLSSGVSTSSRAPPRWSANGRASRASSPILTRTRRSHATRSRRSSGEARSGWATHSTAAAPTPAWINSGPRLTSYKRLRRVPGTVWLRRCGRQATHTTRSLM